MTPEKPGFTRPEVLLLAAVVALGLGLRGAVAWRAPWFWDEGYFVEVARCLAHGRRPQAGGLWEDGFFPLSTSWLAPLSAAPLLALAPGADALAAARIWAVGLQGLAIVLLARLGRRLGGPGLGLCAAAVYAVMPFAVWHGGRCFYHHLAVVFLLAAVADGLDLFGEARPGVLARASLWSGLALAVAYWLWWLPLSWTLLLIWKRPRSWRRALAWCVLPPLLVLCLNVAPDPAGAWWSLRGLAAASSVDAPRTVAAFCRAASGDLGKVPFLDAGLLGLGLAAARRRRAAWAWTAGLMALAVLEPLRQRGDISGIAYPFQPAAPLAALGAAWLTMEAARGWTWGRGALAAAGLALCLCPVNTAWMDLLSFDPAPVGQLVAYFDAHARPGDGVCGMPPFDWRLQPRLRVCDPFGVGAAEGRVSGFYPAGAPAERIAWPCRVADLRYAVLCRIHVLSAFRTPGVALTFLEMQRQRWREVFDNGTFRVYENPRFGGAPGAGGDLLPVPGFYHLAAQDAAKAGRPAARDYALARAATRRRAPATAPTPAGRR